MIDLSLIGLLNQIERDVIVLPAMQRPFVWEDNRIYRLVDSLLRGFPVGAIMLWRTNTIQRFRKIPRDIDVDVPAIFNFETSTAHDERYLVLDGQQRLTSLYAAFKGAYNHRKLFIDILSGSPEGKDPGNEYYECAFMTSGEARARSVVEDGQRRQYVPVQDLIKVNPNNAAKAAAKEAKSLDVGEAEEERIADIYIRCANILGNHKALQVITVDEDPSPEDATPIEEILEIFVRVNSGGLVLQKSDLLMSLLDLTWNDIQPELQSLVQEVNRGRPFEFTRDDLLKSLLLVEGAETRFDRLVNDRDLVKELAAKLPKHLPLVKKAWKLLGVILADNCKIHSERFFRGGHNALLPFVLYLAKDKQPSNDDTRKMTLGIYLSVMSGIFSGAEARMGAFSRRKVADAEEFPLKDLAVLIRSQYGIQSLDDLLKRHLDLSLNIAHGGISIDNNPAELQRDHIFPRSKLENEGYSDEVVNHYANFHFLRAVDNLNKSDKPPHEWFRKPGRDTPPYSDQDLRDRLLTWNDLDPGNFPSMIKSRGGKIRKKAEELFGMSEEDFAALFEQEEA